jgi:hydroxyacyl-ACP dehydratase HTD2-like protein with hotdog domain
MWEQSKDITWVDPIEGFEYRPQTIVVEAVAQRRALEVCGIEPALFGDAVDPSFFIGLAIHAGVESGISSEGNVNMVQSLVQHAPVRLDEEIAVTGRVVKVEDVPRGQAVTSEVWFAGPDGHTAITAKRTSLRPDPAKIGARGAGAKPAPVVEDVAPLNRLSDVVMTPDRVTGYRSDGNAIHFDMKAANAGGFRAPIIGGGMGVHYLAAAIWHAFSPQSVDLDIYFRRPVFWDDQLSVMVDDRNGSWTAICLAKDGKVATEARINGIG